jgi:cobalt-zinc-cadmium resistance protein CzcA
MPVEEAVLSGAASQFRALATLISVAMLGIVPAAIASGIGSAVQRPLATVVLGGLVSTLFVTLLAVPALYFLTEGRSRR